jgi:glyoxylase-like metal-dependent hydrolase (beta-lactamase superfamily II)
MRQISLVSKFAIALLIAVPAFAQIDLSGEWGNIFHEDQPERIPGPEIGDYLGLPINDAARLHADSWDADILTLPEHQCKPHPADYGVRGPANLRIWKEVDNATQRTIAWHTHISWQAPERTIWMDGRPHPSEYAPHTWQGFSTGEWRGDVLTVTTTHLKTGWIRRNGVPRSDRAVLTEHWIRHGDQLTLVSIINDPAYLTEPLVRTTDWLLDPRLQIDPYPCEAVVEVPRPRGEVPHHSMGNNPFLKEFTERHKVPEPAVRGGAATTYPEYRLNPTLVSAPTRAIPTPADRPAIETLPVQGSVYAIVGGGSNMVVQSGRDGVLVVDTKPGAQAEIQKLSTKPIRYIINTSADADHTSANEALAAAGSTITGGNVAGFNAGFGATMVAHEGVVGHMTKAGAPPSSWPNDTYFTEGKDLFVNGEAVQVFHVPAAHTDSDSIVFFRRSDVIAAGDVFMPDRYPSIDVARGGTVNGVLDALNRILDLTVPADKQEGGTMVVPGHGRLCDEADVVEYRDMVTIVRDRIRDLIGKGMTLQQIKAARPTADYDTVYGAPDAFIEAAFKTLSK